MKKIVSGSVILTLLLTSCGQAVVKEEIQKVEAKIIKSEIAKKEVFGEELKLVGKVGPMMESPISAQTAGTIKEIKTEVGKKVKAGDILATIDLSNTIYRASFDNATNAYNNTLTSYDATLDSIKNDLESAKTQLENAKVARENTYSTTEKQLILTQTQLENVTKTKANTFSTTAESMKNAELMVKNAKLAVDNYEKNSTISLDSLYSSINVMIGSVMNTSENVLNYSDTILGITDKNKNFNDSYEVYLGAKDTTIKPLADSLFRQAKGAYDSAATITTSDKEKTDLKLAKTIELLDSEVKLYEQMVNLINSSITAGQLPQAQLDGFSINIQKNQGTILGLQSQLTGLNNSLSQTKTQIVTQKEALDNAYSLAQTQYNSIKAGNTTQIDSITGNETLTQNQLDSTNATIKSARDSVDNAVKIAESTYNSLEAKLVSQKAQVKTQLDSTKGGKDLAKIQLDNTKIVAPFDGIITGRSIEIGGMASPGVPLFTIGSSDNLKIKTELSGDNISSLKIGQEANVQKMDTKLKGIITLISPTADPVSKMYKIEISFVKKPEGIVLGDFVDVFLLKEKQGEKVIQLPYSSLISLGQGEYSAYVVDKENKAKSVQVKIGSQNSTNVIIISGINEGDRVVTSGSMNLQDSDLVEEQK